MSDDRKSENVSIRLPKEMLTTLALIAAGEQSTVSEIIRLAIEQYLNPGKENA
jgi:predicted DNA-binding protein